MSAPITLLSGVVGSTAYGLAHEGSDVDRLAVFTWPTPRYWSLDKVEETFTSTNPDMASHELIKFVRLVLGGNPTVSELLWLEEYETFTPEGELLVGLRSAMLSAPAVRASYLGYARAQLQKGISEENNPRRSKFLRHTFRLLEQGHALYTTGQLTLRVVDPEFYTDLENWNSTKITNEAEERISAFDKAVTILPPQPDLAAVEAFIDTVRRRFLDNI